MSLKVTTTTTMLETTTTTSTFGKWKTLLLLLLISLQFSNHFLVPRHQHRGGNPRRRGQSILAGSKRDSIWWTRFLAPAQRAELLQTPNGRLAKQFRKLFHAPYAVFLDLMSIATERWWPDWTEENRCRAGKLVSSLDLKILGSLFVLAQGVTHYVCSTCSNVSEEVHRSFFHQWLRHMSSIKDEFIFMPYDDLTYHKVSDEYAARGLPGCVGSVDCVHIG